MFQKAIALDPKSEAYMGLGWLYVREKKYTKAEEAFRQYLALIRPKSEVYHGLGSVYGATGRYGEAEKMFKKSIELGPQSGGYRELGRLYTAQKRYDEAEEMFKEHIALMPQDKETYILLAELYNKQGKNKEADELLQGKQL